MFLRTFFDKRAFLKEKVVYLLRRYSYKPREARKRALELWGVYRMKEKVVLEVVDLLNPLSYQRVFVLGDLRRVSELTLNLILSRLRR